ncbi:MAG: acetolactate synthase small subunit [Elusimicrobia bacterium]|jgi:acetolactate synthase-1/3 small subunit|nr:acetolactate synthase small subunit [Elusimicrobiota bacterium]
MTENNGKEQKACTIVIAVENKSGVLARISGLFSARGYNIDSLSVSITEDPSISRMTLTVRGDEKILEQIYKQLNKLVDVIKVYDLTEGDYIDRELALMKVKTTNAAVRQDIMQIASIFRAKVVDIGKQSLTLEVAGKTSKVNAIIEMLKSYGIKEMIRTGKIAMTREFNQRK